MVNQILESRQHRKNLKELIDNGDVSRIRKFFKRHKKDFIIPDDMDFLQLKDKIISYAQNRN